MKEHSQGPTQPAQLKPYEIQAPMGARALQDGKYIVVWGIKDKSSSIVLAYPKDALTQGGTVIMADGTIKKMSAGEVQALAKGRSP